MRRGAIAILLAALQAAVAGAADPQVDEAQRLYSLALDEMLAGQARIMKLADPIRIAGADFCGGDLSPVLGVFAADRYTFRDMFPGEPDFEAEFAKTAKRRFELGKTPTVLWVVPGSPADEAGLRVGDVVEKIDGKRPKRRELEVVRKRLSSDAIGLTLERGGETREIEVESRLGCRAPSLFWFNNGVNAFATRWGDLTGMYVFGGMLRFLESDDELATVLGHELAHLILNHTGTRATSNTEADADYLGLYLAARAGFDIETGARVWDRFARNNPFSTIDWGFYAHPTSPERALLLSATLSEIASKIERGEPLEPEER